MSNDQDNKQQSSTQTQAEESKLELHKIYTVDVSFIATDEHLVNEGWQPQLNIELQTQSKALQENNTHEVKLTVKSTVTSNDKEAFNLEIQQAGIFRISGMDDEQLHHVLGTYCPDVLYPYLREVVAETVRQSGYPQLHLGPVNFEDMYQQELQSQSEQTEDQA